MVLSFFKWTQFLRQNSYNFVKLFYLIRMLKLIIHIVIFCKVIKLNFRKLYQFAPRWPKIYKNIKSISKLGGCLSDFLKLFKTVRMKSE